MPTSGELTITFRDRSCDSIEEIKTGKCVELTGFRLVVSRIDFAYGFTKMTSTSFINHSNIY